MRKSRESGLSIERESMEADRVDFITSVLHEVIKEYGLDNVHVHHIPFQYPYYDFHVVIGLCTVVKVTETDGCLVFDNYTIELADPEMMDKIRGALAALGEGQKSVVISI